jgi:hypothetical protein
MCILTIRLNKWKESLQVGKENGSALAFNERGLGPFPSGLAGWPRSIQALNTETAPLRQSWLKQRKQITHSESANALRLHPVCNGAAASVTA